MVHPDPPTLDMKRGVKATTTPTLREGPVCVEPPLVGRLDWQEEFPWLIQGVTLREDREREDFDLRLRGPAAGSDVLSRWDRLRAGLEVASVIHAHQVHGRSVRVARAPGEGLLLTSPCDGHLTREAGVLLTISVADCVPVFLVEPRTRTVGLLHAGWRGVAAGILEEGFRGLQDRFGIRSDVLHVHLGPAISGPRYEVGPEVHVALGLDKPNGPSPLDLRAHLAERARRAGVHPHRIGVSRVCVLEDSRFFSHRAGDAGRQVAVLGISASGGGGG